MGPDADAERAFNETLSGCFYCCAIALTQVEFSRVAKMAVRTPQGAGSDCSATSVVNDEICTVPPRARRRRRFGVPTLLAACR